ncbi:DUF3122 domain-containing protein [Microcystis aeruginosa]|nr:DUF3122 domain-containing protein [Microcystis aeruginosa]
MAIILAKGENSCPLRNVTNYMGTLRKVKGLRPLIDKGFQLLWYICMGEVQLFKRVKDGETVEISLRLVGFPEGIEFLHPERLTITTAQGQILAAEDAFAQESPAANVGQYKMQDILTQLPVTEAIELSLPLDNPRALTIPTPVLLEWQSLLFSVNGGNPNH